MVVARQCSSMTDPTSLPPRTSKMPKRKVSVDGAAKAELKRRSAWLLAKPAPAKVDAKPSRKKATASDKKVQIKGKRGAKGKQAEVADQQTTDLPAEN